MVSGYYGYGNAGDEAVLAALLQHVSAQLPQSEFVVTSGAPEQTRAMHNLQHPPQEYSLHAVARQDFKALWQEIKRSDLLISGGGSLLQDVTSLRNILYYTGLIRMAHLARKPVVIYAQGIGPLQKSLSRKLTRAALQHPSTRVISVRDPESHALLEKIGVRKPIEITADPVWSLTTPSRNASLSERPIWSVSLRSWLGESTPSPEKKLLQAIRQAARQQNATVKFLAMQPARDRPLIEALGVAPEEILDTEKLHPSQIMSLAGNFNLMIAMRLHALIFAAAQGVPCIAVSYDPKVASLAKLISAPVIANASEGELAKLQTAASTVPASTLAIEELKAKAHRNAELVAQTFAT